LPVKADFVNSLIEQRFTKWYAIWKSCDKSCDN